MSALTRILNNQIYNNTIVGYQKIANATITGTLFSPNITTTSDITIGGNLTVLGTSTYTAIASTNTYVNDPIIVLNNAGPSTNTRDLGLVFYRGTASATAIIWDEFDKDFRFVYTPETGSTYGTITQSSFANLTIGNITTVFAAAVGTLSATGNISTLGNVVASGNVIAQAGGYLVGDGRYITNVTGTFGNAQVSYFLQTYTGSIGGTLSNVAQLNITSVGTLANLNVNGPASITGILYANSATTATSSTSGGLVVAGGAAVAGNVYAGRTLFSAAGTVSTGTFNGIYSDGIILDYATNNGRISVGAGDGITFYTGGLATTQLLAISSLGVLTATGNIIANSGYASLGYSSGALQVVGGAGITGNLYVGAGIQNTVIGNVTPAAGYFTTLNTTGNLLAVNVQSNFVTASKAEFGNISAKIIGNVGATITGGNLTISADTSLGLTQAAAINNTPIGNATPSTATFTTLTAQKDTSLGLTTASAINDTPIGNATPSTAVFSYAIAGNVQSGFIGNTNTAFTGASLNLSGNVLAAAVQATNINAGGYINAVGNVLASSATVGALTVNGAINTTGNLLAATVNTTGLNAGGTIYANATTPSTTLTTGAVVVAGGVGIAGNLNVGGNLLTNGQTTINNTLTATGITSITNTTPATAFNSAALTVSGGVGIAGSLYVQGNIYAANIIGTIANVLTVSNPLLYLSVDHTYPYNFDIGFYSHFIGGPANVYAHSGVVRDNADGYWKIFSNVAADPEGSQVTFNSDTIYDGVKAGNLILTDSTASISTGTGALVVAGGAGVGGTVTAGAFNTAGNVLAVQFVGSGSLLTALPGYAYSNVNVAAYTQTMGYTNYSNVNVIAYIAGGISSTGFINTSGNVSGAGVNAGTLNVTGTSTVAGITSTGFINTSGNVSAATVIAGQFNTTGNLVAGQVSTGTLNATGFINTSGNVSAVEIISRNLSTRSAYGNIHLTQFASIFAQGNNSENQSIVQVSTTGLSDGMGMWGFTGLNGRLFSTKGINFVTGVTVRDQDTPTGGVGLVTITPAGDLWANATTSSTSTITGAFVVKGGVGIAGNIFQGGAYHDTSASNFILGSTPTFVDAFSSATAINLGSASTGTLTINNPTIATSVTSGTLALVNTGLTGTLNFAGAAGTINIGAATGAVNMQGTASAAGVIYANLAVNTSSTDTGAIIRPNGGLSASGNIYAGETVFIGPSAFSLSSLANPAIVAVENGTGYAQIALLNATGTGSADYVAYADIGNDAGGWMDMGMTGSFFNDPAYTITKRQDGYIIARPSSGIFGGNLVIATSEAGRFNDVVIGVGGFLADAEVARFHGNVQTNGNLRIHLTTTSTSTTSGALQVFGGVGIGENLNVGGGTTINSNQDTTTFTVKGAVDSALIVATAGKDGVVIGGQGNALPQAGVSLKVGGTGAMMVPVGTGFQTPGLSGNVDLPGMIRFNTGVNALQFYDGEAWQSAGLSSAFTVIQDLQLSGDGANVAFSLSGFGSNVSTNSTLVTINGVVQIPTAAYSCTGTTLTFTEPPEVGDLIDVRFLATTSSVTTITNGYSGFDVNSGFHANVTTGGVIRTSVDSSGHVNLVNGTKTTYNQSGINIPTNGTPFAVDTFSPSSYSTSKYIVQAKNGGNVESYEALVVTDGSTVAQINVYNTVNAGYSMGSLSANVYAGAVTLWYTSSGAAGLNANVKVQSNYIV